MPGARLWHCDPTVETPTAQNRKGEHLDLETGKAIVVDPAPLVVDRKRLDLFDRLPPKLVEALWNVRLVSAHAPTARCRDSTCMPVVINQAIARWISSTGPSSSTCAQP